MELENKSLGKLNGKKCYINNGKYGFYLSHDAKNYKGVWFWAAGRCLVLGSGRG